MSLGLVVLCFFVGICRNSSSLGCVWGCFAFYRCFEVVLFDVFVCLFDLVWFDGECFVMGLLLTLWGLRC